jgi:hypothetical protein
VVRSCTGAPARAQPVQLASLVVVTQSSSSMGLPQYVSLNCGLATCTLPIPFAWRMFISLPFAACSPSLTPQSTNVWSRALRNDGVEWVGKHTAWAAIQAADVTEVSGFLAVALDEPHVPPVVETASDLDRLRGKTTISMLARRRTPPLSASTCTYASGSRVTCRKPGPVTSWSSRRSGGRYGIGVVHGKPTVPISPPTGPVRPAEGCENWLPRNLSHSYEVLEVAAAGAHNVTISGRDATLAPCCTSAPGCLKKETDG